MTIKVKSNDVAKDKPNLLVLLGATTSPIPPVVPPVVPPVIVPGISPDGSTLLASGVGSLITTDGTWTFGAAVGSDNRILLNGNDTGGWAQSMLVANQGKLYVLNSGSTWYLWTGAWTALARGATPTATPVVPPVTPPVGFPPLSPSLMFFGDQGNNGFQATQATTADLPLGTVAMPCFAVLFFRQIDHTTFGMLTSYGNQPDHGRHVISLSGQGSAMVCFDRFDGGNFTMLRVGGAPPIGQWSHIVMKINSASDVEVIQDGVPYAGPETAGYPPNPVLTWPAPEADGSGLKITFGSYFTLTATPGPNPDCHVFNGTMRNAAWVSGTPTDAEIARHQGGESAVSIWGTRVICAWDFDAIPILDTSGHGHDLTLIDGGSAAGHSLPILVTT